MDDVQVFKRASENTYPPHFPYITKNFIAETLKILLNYKWIPIACEGISLEMNQLAGIIKAVPGRNPNIYDYLVEAAFPKDHPIGVRAISHGGKVDIRVKLPNAIADIGITGVFGEIWNSIKQFRRKPVYLEFSYTKLPVGWKKQRLIFWEYHELKEEAV